MFDVIGIGVDGKVIGGKEVEYGLTAFELFNGNEQFDGDYIRNYFTLGLLIIPSIMIIINLFFSKKRNVELANAIAGIVMIALFIYGFIHMFNLYKNGIEVSSTIIIATDVKLKVAGYIYIIIMLAFTVDALINFIKKKSSDN